VGARSAVDSPTREALFGRIGVFAGFETNPRRGHGAGEQDVNESSPANFKAAIGKTVSKFVKLQAMPKEIL
jgi:hypothetical protein